jgi:Putative prokaryotic signal transducing protein
MPDDEWVLIDQAQGQLQAEIIKGLLEAQGIMVWLNQEGAAHAYAIEIGTLGTVEILVPSSMVVEAQAILDEYKRGDFEDIELWDGDSG